MSVIKADFATLSEEQVSHVRTTYKNNSTYKIRLSQEELTQHFNSLFGLSKSRRTYARIWNSTPDLPMKYQ